MRSIILQWVGLIGVKYDMTQKAINVQPVNKRL